MYLLLGRKYLQVRNTIDYAFSGPDLTPHGGAFLLLGTFCMMMSVDYT